MSITLDYQIFPLNYQTYGHTRMNVQTKNDVICMPIMSKMDVKQKKLYVCLLLYVDILCLKFIINLVWDLNYLI